jgi:PAS domain S-box-containing protein
MIDQKQQRVIAAAQTDLLELAHDAVLVRDVATGVLLYWNRGAEEVYGYRREDALGKVSHELLQTEFPVPLTQIEAAMVGEGRWEGELIHRARDGRKLTIESRWALQRDAGDEPIAFLEINRDITARKAAAAEAARRVQELAAANREIALRHRELEAINRSMAAISRSLDLAEVLQNIADAARDLLQARYAALGVADSRGHITQFMTSGITPEERAAIGPLPQGHGLLGTLIRDAIPLRVRNIAEDPRRHGFPSNHPPMRSLLGVPIVSKGRVLGDLYLADKIGADEFSGDDQNLLALLAAHAAVAIENSQLYEDVRDVRDQLRAWNQDLEAMVAERTQEVERISREMTARVLQAQEEERGRIARELHDETAQSLVRLLVDLDLLKSQSPEDSVIAPGLSTLADGLKRTLDEVRALSHDLRPAILEDFGLAAAIEAYAQDCAATFGVSIRVQVEEHETERLPRDVEVGVFRIAQEAMMNAGKYAQAREVAVSLTYSVDRVRLAIEDDGAGFNPEDLRVPSWRGGLGLFGMRERAALLGGSLTIDTEPGKGTRVTLLAPVRGG